MLASTVQFSNNTHTPPTPTHTGKRRHQRVHTRKPTPPRTRTHRRAHGTPGLFPQSPTACRLAPPTTHHRPPQGPHRMISCTKRGQCPPTSNPGMHPRHATRHHMLLRKEVIQPHLPVRLPCYDFVPIADPTFDGSLPTRGLGHRLRVLPT